MSCWCTAAMMPSILPMGLVIDMKPPPFRIAVYSPGAAKAECSFKQHIHAFSPRAPCALLPRSRANAWS